MYPFIRQKKKTNRRILLLKKLFLVGSFSRSAVNYMAGCKTAMSNVVMSIVVLLTLLLITPLFKYTPNAILSAIIISAVVGLVDYESAYLIWKVDKLDFLACLGAFFGVVFASVEYGLLVAVRLTTIFLICYLAILRLSFLRIRERFHACCLSYQ
jgi:sulfate transporter 1, high-affinity